MMHRNLDRRVEALVRIVEPAHLSEIDDMFERAMDERTASWWLGPDGDWTRHHLDEDGAPLADLQNQLMQHITHRKRTATRSANRASSR
ncbi:polyphosphate kinase [Rathayibacter tanaceti]|nr:polyphosphate kinase [Rathayibacter tanaceti]